MNVLQAASLVGLAALSAASASDAAPLSGQVAASETQLKDSSDGFNWPAFGRTYGEQHFSPLKEIDRDNVSRLGLVWAVDLPPGNSITGPIEIGGVVYVASGYSVVRAIAVDTGKVLWKYDPHAPEAAGRKLRTGWGSRGIAWWDGKVYVGTHDGRLIAIDAKTGKVVWSVMTLEKDDYRFISGAPRAFAGKIIVGHGGADTADTRGYVTAYDAETGKQLWRFYTVPGDPAKGFENSAMKMAAKTWSGQWWKYGGGGTAWNAFTYDEAAHSIIIGVGNGAPWNQRIRSEGKGDNLFLASIVALDADTGAYKWHYQVNPGESWDYSAAMDMELADLMIAGERRQVLMTAPKNGFFYVIDRVNGRLISAEPFARVSWASKIDLETGRPVENPDARYPAGKTMTMWPGSVGAHSSMPMAFSPQTALVYIPTVEMATTYNDVGIDTKHWVRLPGDQNDGGVKMGFPRDDSQTDKDSAHSTSSLLAWNPVTQKAAWRVATPGMWSGGLLATGGNLVFQGQLDAQFRAYSADTGNMLWSFAAQAPVLSSPISYMVGGKQYITVVTGISSASGTFGPRWPISFDYRTQARRVLTFVLDATGILPQAKPFRVVAAEDSGPPLVEAMARAGGDIYFKRCVACHGIGLVASGTAPDLRASSIAMSPTAFDSVVRKGQLVPAGMPRFEEITDEELKTLREFIRSEANILRDAAK